MRLIQKKVSEPRHFDRMNWDTVELPIGMRFTKASDMKTTS